MHRSKSSVQTPVLKQFSQMEMNRAIHMLTLYLIYNLCGWLDEKRNLLPLFWVLNDYSLSLSPWNRSAI